MLLQVVRPSISRLSCQRAVNIKVMITVTIATDFVCGVAKNLAAFCKIELSNKSITDVI